MPRKKDKKGTEQAEPLCDKTSVTNAKMEDSGKGKKGEEETPADSPEKNIM